MLWLFLAASLVLPISESPEECAKREAQAFFTCLPPAVYVPNPGHCEFPIAGSVPPYAPVVVLCGIAR